MSGSKSKKTKRKSVGSVSGNGNNSTSMSSGSATSGSDDRKSAESSVAPDDTLVMIAKEQHLSGKQVSIVRFVLDTQLLGNSSAENVSPDRLMDLTHFCDKNNWDAELIEEKLLSGQIPVKLSSPIVSSSGGSGSSSKSKRKSNGAKKGNNRNSNKSKKSGSKSTESSSSSSSSSAAGVIGGSDSIHQQSPSTTDPSMSGISSGDRSSTVETESRSDTSESRKKRRRMGPASKSSSAMDDSGSNNGSTNAKYGRRKARRGGSGSSSMVSVYGSRGGKRKGRAESDRGRGRMKGRAGRMYHQGVMLGGPRPHSAGGSGYSDDSHLPPRLRHHSGAHSNGSRNSSGGIVVSAGFQHWRPTVTEKGILLKPTSRNQSRHMAADDALRSAVQSSRRIAFSNPGHHPSSSSLSISSSTMKRGHRRIHRSSDFVMMDGESYSESAAAAITVDSKLTSSAEVQTDPSPMIPPIKSRHKRLTPPSSEDDEDMDGGSSGGLASRSRRSATPPMAAPVNRDGSYYRHQMSDCPPGFGSRSARASAALPPPRPPPDIGYDDDSDAYCTDYGDESADAKPDSSASVSAQCASSSDQRGFALPDNVDRRPPGLVSSSSSSSSSRRRSHQSRPIAMPAHYSSDVYPERQQSLIASSNNRSRKEVRHGDRELLVSRPAPSLSQLDDSSLPEMDRPQMRSRMSDEDLCKVQMPSPLKRDLLSNTEHQSRSTKMERMPHRTAVGTKSRRSRPAMAVDSFHSSQSSLGQRSDMSDDMKSDDKRGVSLKVTSDASRDGSDSKGPPSKSRPSVPRVYAPVRYNTALAAAPYTPRTAADSSSYPQSGSITAISVSSNGSGPPSSSYSMPPFDVNSLAAVVHMAAAMKTSGPPALLPASSLSSSATSTSAAVVVAAPPSSVSSVPSSAPAMTGSTVPNSSSSSSSKTPPMRSSIPTLSTLSGGTHSLLTAPSTLSYPKSSSKPPMKTLAENEQLNDTYETTMLSTFQPVPLTSSGSVPLSTKLSSAVTSTSSGVSSVSSTPVSSKSGSITSSIKSSKKLDPMACSFTPGPAPMVSSSSSAGVTSTAADTVTANTSTTTASSTLSTGSTTTSHSSMKPTTLSTAPAVAASVSAAASALQSVNPASQQAFSVPLSGYGSKVSTPSTVDTNVTPRLGSAGLVGSAGAATSAAAATPSMFTPLATTPATFSNPWAFAGLNPSLSAAAAAANLTTNPAAFLSALQPGLGGATGLGIPGMKTTPAATTAPALSANALASLWLGVLPTYSSGSVTPSMSALGSSSFLSQPSLLTPTAATGYAPGLTSAPQSGAPTTGAAHSATSLTFPSTTSAPTYPGTGAASYFDFSSVQQQ